MKVSVIIPVYNVAPYLERCIHSVLRQTYKDIEVIIIDDGSTDGCSELCDEIAKTDKRIIVIHQENQGLSAARNTGIHHAAGEYIIFLDSDDAWILDNGLEILVERGKLECDLKVFKNIDFWEKGHSTCPNDYDVEYLNQLSDAQAVFLHLVRTQTLRISACFIVVRRQILIDYDILFPNGIISEDLTWSLHLWQHIKTVKLVNIEFYGYYHRNDSITTTIANTLHAFQCYDRMFIYWKEQCDQGCVNAAAIRIYLANMWVSRGYIYYKLHASEKNEALAILRRHTNLLRYAETPKSQRTAWLLSHFGVRCTIIILGLYWCLRTFIIGHKIENSY